MCLIWRLPEINSKCKTESGLFQQNASATVNGFACCVVIAMSHIHPKAGVGCEFGVGLGQSCDRICNELDV
eukprot:11278093-Heterocapsa_arctica.AAC.1